MPATNVTTPIPDDATNVTTPIPVDAFDDRIGFIGNTGSGKTYGAGVCVESLLRDGRRCVVADPLGVWWGLRLRADGASSGTPSDFDVVIFGGPRGDVSITENAGAVIGETVASMKESAIIDLSEIGTRRGERRFMRHFLSAMYRHVKGEPVHLVMDEADMWAPQQIRDKEGGDSQALLGQMETIVRRGRVKGFIPWLITQRPAVLNKDVLSQVDGLVAFKLTSLQDRKALGAWIEGQADREEGKRIFADLATLERGHAIVWLPARDILKPATFPPKETYDSSRTPKRGEKRESVELRPLDVGALRERLATVEAAAKENDPSALKKRIAELERQVKAAGSPAPDDGKASFQQGYEEGRFDGIQLGWGQGRMAFLRVVGASLIRAREDIVRAIQFAVDELGDEGHPFHPSEFSEIPQITTRPAPSRPLKKVPPKPAPAPPPPGNEAPGHPADLTGPETRIVKAIVFWKQLGYDSPTRDQVAAVAGYSVKSGAFKNPAGALNTRGVISYPEPGKMTLNVDPGPMYVSRQEAAETFKKVIGGPGVKILTAIRDQTVYTRRALAILTDYSETSGAFKNPLGRLRTLGAVTYPMSGAVQIEPWAAEILSE